MKNIILNLLAFNIIFSGIITITAMNPVISVIYLIGTFFNAAGYLILSGVTFVGISYLIIYVGAIAVLFLFVIMMINIKLTDILETGNQFTKNIPLALAIGVLFVFIILSIVPFNSESPISMILSLITFLNLSSIFLPAPSYIDSVHFDATLSNSFFSTFSNYNPLNTQSILNTPETIITDFGQIEVLGHALYTSEGVLLLILSITLLLAMVSSLIISKTRNNILILHPSNNKNAI